MFNGRIFVCADTHGQAAAINAIVNSIENPTEEDVIIIAGDAGFEYGDYVMGQAKRAAKKFPGKWIVMRGNHDNCYMNDHLESLSEGGQSFSKEGWTWLFNNNDCYIYQNRYPNILYIDDNGGIYTIGKYNFLFLPGAYSVDKDYRLRMGYPYNPDEQLTYETMENIYDMVKDWNKNDFPIDYVIGHSFPMWLQPYYSYLFMSSIDQSKVDHKTEQWLGAMSELFEANPAFKCYYGGHFHDEKMLKDKYMMVYQNPIEIKE